EAPTTSLGRARVGDVSPGAALRAFVDQAGSGDYVAILAYLAETPAVDAALQVLRVAIRDRCRVATALGFGPRYLHSTGQYHKGGPPTGVFLQLTAETERDVPIPGQPYTFGVLAAAQALGDLEALRSRARPVLRINLGRDPVGGLRRVMDDE
ncbi:MAG: transaldolase, partial [Chloroflexi bacterium]|nr:transaldolase [Chloroflexota bacterium]